MRSERVVSEVARFNNQEDPNQSGEDRDGPPASLPVHGVQSCHRLTCSSTSQHLIGSPSLQAATRSHAFAQCWPILGSLHFGMGIRLERDGEWFISSLWRWSDAAGRKRFSRWVQESAIRRTSEGFVGPMPCWRGFGLDSDEKVLL